MVLGYSSSSSTRIFTSPVLNSSSLSVESHNLGPVTIAMPDTLPEMPVGDGVPKGKPKAEEYVLSRDYSASSR